MAIQLGDGVVSIKGDLSGFSNALDDLRSMSGKIFTVVGGAITGALGLASRSAIKFQDDLSNVNTLGVRDIRGLGEAVKDVAIKFGVDLTEAVRTAYQAISATLPEEAMKRLNDAVAKASIAGKGSFASAFDAMTSIMNSFGTATGRTSDIVREGERTLGILVAGVKGGKTDIDQLGASVGRAASIFSDAGVTQEEFISILAALTTTGSKARQQITAMKAALQNIIAPSEEAKEASRLLGIEFNVEQVRLKGLVPFLVEVRQKILDQIPAIKKGKVELETRGNQLIANIKQGKAFKEALEDEAVAIREHGRRIKGLHPLMEENEAAARRNTEQQRLLTRALGKQENELAALSEEYEIVSGLGTDYISILATMFPSVEGVNAILAIADNRLDAFNATMVDAKKGMSLVNEMFQRQIDNNPAFVYRQMTSSIQVLEVEIGDKLKSSLSKTFKLVVDGIAIFRKWMKNNVELSTTIVKVVAVVGAVLGVLGPLLLLLPTIAGGFATIATAIVVMLSPIGGLIVIVGALVVAFGLWLKNTADLQSLLEKFLSFIGPFSKKVIAFFKDLVKTIEESEFVKRFNKEMEQLPETLAKVEKKMIEFGNMMMKLWVDELAPALFEIWETIGDFLVENFAFTIEDGLSFLIEATRLFVTTSIKLWNGVRNFLVDNWEQIKRIFGLAVKAVISIVEIFADALDIFFNFLRAIFVSFVGTMNDEWGELSGVTEEGSESVLDLIEIFITEAARFLEILKEKFEIAKQFWDEWWPVVARIMNIGWNILTEMFSSKGGELIGFLILVKGGFNALRFAIELITKVFNIFRDSINFVGNSLGKLFQILKDLSSFGGGGRLPQFAQGGIVKSPLQLVGSKDDELAALPRGTRVFSAGDTQAMLNSALSGNGSGGSGTTIVIKEQNLLPGAIIRENVDVNRFAEELGDLFLRDLEVEGSDSAGGIE